MISDIISKNWTSIDDLILELSSEVENESERENKITELETKVNELETEIAQTREANISLLSKLAKRKDIIDTEIDKKDDEIEEQYNDLDDLYEEKELLNDIVEEMAKEF